MKEFRQSRGIMGWGRRHPGKFRLKENHVKWNSSSAEGFRNERNGSPGPAVQYLLFKCEKVRGLQA